MSSWSADCFAAQTATDAVERLSCRDPTLEGLYLYEKKLTEKELSDIADCLLAHPDVVRSVYLGINQLTDETGVKLARYLAASSSIQMLELSYNRLGEATYLAVAAALRVNDLFIFANQEVDQARIDAAFVEALRLNPDRPARSEWQLYSYSYDFHRLKAVAEQLGHPSLQLLLALLC